MIYAALAGLLLSLGPTLAAAVEPADAPPAERHRCIWWTAVNGFFVCSDSVPVGTPRRIILARQAQNAREAFGPPARRRRAPRRACTATGYGCTTHRQCCTGHCSDTITGHWCLEPGPGDP